MKRLVQIMYAVTAGLEQSVIVWESMKQAEKLALQAPQQVKQPIGFASQKPSSIEGLQKSSSSPLDPARTVPTL